MLTQTLVVIRPPIKLFFSEAGGGPFRVLLYSERMNATAEEAEAEEAEEEEEKKNNNNKMYVDMKHNSTKREDEGKTATQTLDLVI